MASAAVISAALRAGLLAGNCDAIDGVKLTGFCDAFAAVLSTYGLGDESRTVEGGYTITKTNKTGAPSVKGTLVVIDTTADNAVALAGVGADDAIGVVYDAGVADGSEIRVVVAGVADVLIEAGDTISRRRWLRTPTATAGRGSLGAVAGGGSVAEHFKECGHCLETKANGGSTLARCVVHFN